MGGLLRRRTDPEEITRGAVYESLGDHTEIRVQTELLAPPSSPLDDRDRPNFRPR